MNETWQSLVNFLPIEKHLRREVGEACENQAADQPVWAWSAAQNNPNGY